MLASRKQEWVIEEEVQQQIAPSSNTGLSRKNAKLRVKCFLMVTMIALAAMFVTFRSEAIIRTGYDLVQTKAQILKYERENEALRLDIAKLKSPQRIQHIATIQFGMVVPQNVYQASNVQSDMTASKNANNASVASTIMEVLKSGKAEASKGR
ncbi:Cell division protein FtsL [bioreactor metagenome]|uniref:Cell division protein FtsL n=1 Tax=bioreactor metagenome TaxID=1076179 RepID=A0A644T1J8_9ZZZZ|nr:cell division protein FtsL [Negativicutes bacterium]